MDLVCPNFYNMQRKKIGKTVDLGGTLKTAENSDVVYALEIYIKHTNKAKKFFEILQFVQRTKIDKKLNVLAIWQYKTKPLFPTKESLWDISKTKKILYTVLI